MASDRNFEPLGVLAVVRGVGPFKSDLEQMGAATEKQRSRFERMGKGAISLGRGMTRLGSSLSSLGLRMSFLVSGPIALLSKSIAETAASFETETTKINTLVGLSMAEVDKLSDIGRQISRATGVGPSEIARAAFVTTSAGIRDVAQASEVLEAAAKASAIGLGDVQEVARTTTAVMQAYSDTNMTAGRATDILTSIVREGNLEAEKLAPTLGRVIGLAAEMGVSFEEAGAFIATFTRLGVPAEVAVTSLRSALTAIIKPTQASLETLADFGIGIEDVRAAIADPSVGLSEVLLGLSAAFGSNDEAMAKFVGNTRGLAGVLGVTGNLADDYVDILDNVQDSAGIVDEGFQIVSKTTTFMWNQLKANAADAAISLGEGFLPVLNEILTELIELAKIVSHFAAQNPELVKSFLKWAAIGVVIGPIIAGLGILVSMVGVVVQAFGGAILVIGKVASLLFSLGVIIKSVATSLGIDLASALIAILGTFGAATDETMGNLETNMRSWGKSITEAFAQGMAEGIIAVLNVISMIGMQITYWLQSFSPPRLLPNLEKWGAGALSAYMEGWLDGDMSPMKEIADRIEAQITVLRRRIADVNRGFDEATRPIDSRLREIQRVYDAFSDAKRTKELEEILADPFAPEDAKKLARLELEEITLRAEKRDLEDQRDDELSVLQRQEDLLSDMLEIIKERLPKENKGGREKSEFPKLTGWTPPGTDDKKGRAPWTVESALLFKQDFLFPDESISPLEDLQRKVEAISLALTNAKEAWAGTFDALEEKVPLLKKIGTGFLVIFFALNPLARKPLGLLWLTAKGIYTISRYLGATVLLPAIKGAVSAIAGSSAAASLVGAFGALGTAIVTFLTGPFGWLVFLLGFLIGMLGAQHDWSLTSVLMAAGEAVTDFSDVMKYYLVKYLISAIDTMRTLLMLVGFLMVWAFTTLKTKVTDLWEDIKNNLLGALDSAKTKFETLTTWIGNAKDKIGGFIDKVWDGIEALGIFFGMDMGVHQEHSPSEFQRSMHNAAASVHGLWSTMAMPAYAAGFMGTSNKSVSIDMGGVTINNDLDMKQFKGQVRQTVSEAIA